MPYGECIQCNQEVLIDEDRICWECLKKPEPGKDRNSMSQILKEEHWMDKLCKEILNIKGEDKDDGSRRIKR